MPDEDGALTTVFDILTRCTPGNGDIVCKVIEAISGFLLTLPDPRAKGFGVALAGLAKLFRLRGIKRRKRG